ncbi:patatin-like phospholipase family protein [Roseateles terrae]|uniref:NTE family protein n=1 Tax=Roseateles terrae TaxID=431060 RepID=A0ABR6GN57_9BURK|nr:patatin-like phospholipase family protein [Roseateles terrae]MBB3193549.1 NTE family protein [Roseateles terrae]
MSADAQVYFCLGGGSALGAYGAGAAATLLERGIAPDVLCGVSVGATVAAIVAGNRPEDRVPRLQQYWHAAQSGDLPMTGMALSATGADSASSLPALSAWHAGTPAAWRAGSNALHAMSSLITGRPGFFRPRWPGVLSLLPFMPPDPGMFDPHPLLKTLPAFIDFEWLHREGPRLVIDAVDVETGETVRFDSRRDRITPEHLVAAASLPPAFPPVRLGQRSLVDAGLVANVPLDLALFEASGRRTVYAVDPFCLGGVTPTTLDESAQRAQDLAFSAQTERTLEALRREQRLRAQLNDRQPRPATGRATDGKGPRDAAPRRSDDEHLELLLANYRAPSAATGLKALDFSGRSLRERWEAGAQDMEQLLRMRERGQRTETGEGYAIYRQSRQQDVATSAPDPSRRPGRHSPLIASRISPRTSPLTAAGFTPPDSDSATPSDPAPA